MIELTRRRGEGCSSDLRLDQLLAGELDATLEADTRAHLAGCQSCGERFSAIERARAEFLAAPPLLQALSARASLARPVPLSATKPGSRLARVAPLVAAGLAAAAALVLWQKEPAPSTRTKGNGDSIGFYVARGGSTELGGPGTNVYPNDRLQFFYSTPNAGYLALFSVDGERHASVYFPAGSAAARIEPGREVPLTSSVTLDGVLGRESVYGMFCKAPFELEPLRAALQSAPEQAPARAGCVVDRLELAKRAAP